MNNEISDLVNFEGKTIGKIVLPKKFDCYPAEIITNYNVGTEPEGCQDSFAHDLIDKNKTSMNLIKRAYEKNGKVTLVLNHKHGDDKATTQINELFGNYLCAFADEHFLSNGAQIKSSQNGFAYEGLNGIEHLSNDSDIMQNIDHSFFALNNLVRAAKLLKNEPNKPYSPALRGNNNYAK